VSKPELALWGSEDGTGRAYKHPFRVTDELDSKGKPKPLTSPSVTTVLKLVDKSGLSQWAADMTLQWAVENASLLLSKSDESATRWGRYRWTDVRDERAEVGTGIHETIESIHTGRWNYPPLDAEQERIMKQWSLLNQRYEITPHLSEFTVWSIEHDYAGTGDGLWDVLDRETGEFFENLVIDLKTSRNKWPEHWLQLSALRGADVIMSKQDDGTWVEVDMPETSGVAIVHLREDKHEIDISTDQKLHELRFQTFQNYRSIWSLNKNVEARIKDLDTPEPFSGF
jgi:hypothetical protein